jgi:hypothetical protein
MSRKPPGRYFVGLNWECYKARLMTVLTTDAWAMALAAVIAVLLSHTTLTLALRVSTVSARHWRGSHRLRGLRELRMSWAKWNKVR